MKIEQRSEHIRPQILPFPFRLQEITPQDIERLFDRRVGTYVSALHSIEKYTSFFKRIAPPVLLVRLERAMGENYSWAEGLFDRKFAEDIKDFTNFMEEKRYPSQAKGLFARWACATVADELRRIGEIHPNPRPQQSLLLAARRVILYGAKVTQELGEEALDPEWVRQLAHDAMWEENPLLLQEKLRQFVENPPRATNLS